mmetsp:Transcript_9884/g.20774  ORF Transcript_9884/g.20774 Transcript_9884/m.20774 type:complete len:83 (-) Transcript_9884:1100-1348(-)
MTWRPRWLAKYVFVKSRPPTKKLQRRPLLPHRQHNARKTAKSETTISKTQPGYTHHKPKPTDLLHEDKALFALLVHYLRTFA